MSYDYAKIAFYITFLLIAFTVSEARLVAFDWFEYSDQDFIFEVSPPEAYYLFDDNGR